AICRARRWQEKIRSRWPASPAAAKAAPRSPSIAPGGACAPGYHLSLAARMNSRDCRSRTSVSPERCFNDVFALTPRHTASLSARLFVVLTRIGLIFVVREAFFSRDLAASDDARLQITDHRIDFVERQHARRRLEIARPGPLRTPVTLPCRVHLIVE